MNAVMRLVRERGLDWFNVTWFIVIHGLSVVALFFFSWPALLAMLFLHWLTGGLGVCLGYHRLLTHKSFQTHRWIKLMLAWFGTLSGQGSIRDWIAQHHKHHCFSDEPEDPHSPVGSFFWGHMGWLLLRRTKEEKRALWDRYGRHLARDPALRQIERRYSWMGHLGVMSILFFGGSWWWHDLYMGLSLLLWGMAVRMALVFHCTWLVNSLSHRWGYQTHRDTGDQSRNNWLVALITYGEGWHNNHHADARAANHGRQWYEIDLTYLTILAMEKLGLAWDIKRAET